MHTNLVRKKEKIYTKIPKIKNKNDALYFSNNLTIVRKYKRIYPHCFNEITLNGFSERIQSVKLVIHGQFGLRILSVYDRWSRSKNNR